MKITCAVEISNRAHAGTTIRNKKYNVATLTLSHTSHSEENSNEDVTLILCTRQYPKGTKYKVHNNIKKLLTKFISSGKATIQLKEPPHDILVSGAEPHLLKDLLRGIDLVIRGKDTGHVKFSTAPTKFDPSKTKLTITNSVDYIRNTNFPSSLITLQVVHCSLARIDHRILKLKYLQVLNLACNCIKELPLSLADIPLKQLDLNHNEISTFPKALAVGALGQNLRFLNLSFNKVSELSPYFCLMKKIGNLFLCGNQLKQLPHNIQCLESLKNLRASKNNIQILPFAICTLHLNTLDISYNPIDTNAASCFNMIMDTPSSLLDYAAGAIVEQKVPYSKNDIPPHLMDYLINYSLCFCGRKVFHNKFFYVRCVSDQSQIATIVIHNLSSFKVPLKVYFCSRKCGEK
ncbi:leucine-rich repeat protein 1-like [Uloborus diversus]|uniref:leucine-rich repeat protein 1-like n=1 Tax=Uloborus diversus TaxID=327109 RepID=UPI002408F2A5|nr:leucine-rich repeat protein 1-like [Uloborus diversus]